MERSFKKEVELLRLGEGEEVRNMSTAHLSLYLYFSVFALWFC